MLNVVTLSVVMLNVVMLSVVAPLEWPARNKHSKLVYYCRKKFYSIGPYNVSDEERSV
jgi:hypothetical protein